MFSLLCKTAFAKRSFSYHNQLLSLPNISILSCVFNGLLKKSYSTNPNINHKAPFTMKLDSLEFKSLFTQGLCQLADIFKENSYEIRIAGGAVRDLLLGIKPKDVDFATTATPDEMKAMFEIYNIKMINNKGEKHGTITARIDQENFEITTLRIDVTTDGRHAEVEFTTDWKIDANRRDLTINSMFLGLDGTLYDYFNGHEDLKRRKIAFVGDPEKRIKEDYLRILRYFRFYGRIATSPDNHDPECLRMIKENNEGLKRISGERIWLELQKIVIGNCAGDILKSMENVGLFPLIGLPAEPNMNELDTVLERTKNMKVNPITVIAALLANEDQMLDFHTRCKLSSYERDLGLFIIRNRKDKSGSLISYQKLIVYTKAKTQDSKEWAVELIKYKDDVTFIHDIQSWTVPRFPVSGNTLFQLGVPAGKKMGVVIDHLKLLWVDSAFKLTTEELSQKVPEILSELNITKEVKN